MQTSNLQDNFCILDKILVMLHSLYIFLFIICCDGNCYPFSSLSTSELLLFSFCSFCMISILLLYYSRIPKSNSKKNNLNTPIYQSKDVLLQEISTEGNYLIAEKTTSTWVKAIIYIFIAIIIFTPFYELIGVEYFL